MNYSEKNEFKELLVRCFGDMATPILESPSENILKCTMDSLNAFIHNLSLSMIDAAIDSADDRDYDALNELKNTYMKVMTNLEYFKEPELFKFARKYLEDNHIDLSTENGARDFALFEDCMKRSKKDFLNFSFPVEDFLIPDILHVFIEDTIGMFAEEQESAVFTTLTPRVA